VTCALGDASTLPIRFLWQGNQHSAYGRQLTRLSVVWAVYSTKKGMAREFTRLNITLPDWVTLSNDGIKFDSSNGATSFYPWSNFKGWREGRRVLLMDQSQGGFVIRPISDLADVERQALRDTLRSHLPQ
jgi:hypothetical protein